MKHAIEERNLMGIKMHSHAYEKIRFLGFAVTVLQYAFRHSGPISKPSANDSDDALIVHRVY